MRGLEAEIGKKLKNFELDAAFSQADGCLGILGPSGCGKSMTLRAVAGLVRPDRGRICLDGRILFDSGKRVDLSVQKRKVGYLFQNYALFPNMTVAENIRAGMRKGPAAGKNLAELVRRFHLEGLEGRYPGQLSGGQQQRTALARIFASDAQCLLLDEPFSAMDSYLREEMQIGLAQIIREFEGCMVLVSHDRDEIYRLCDRTLIMENGKSVVCGGTRELFARPRRVAAARLTGCKNLSRIRRAGDFQVHALDWHVTLQTKEPVTSRITHVGIRAHDILPAPEEEDAPNRIRVLVKEKVYSPFEWTLVFQNLEEPGAGIWMKRERGDMQVPEAVTVDPAKILLLEE